MGRHGDRILLNFTSIILYLINLFTYKSEEEEEEIYIFKLIDHCGDDPINTPEINEKFAKGLINILTNHYSIDSKLCIDLTDTSYGLSTAFLDNAIVKTFKNNSYLIKMYMEGRLFFVDDLDGCYVRYLDRLLSQLES